MSLVLQSSSTARKVATTSERLRQPENSRRSLLMHDQLPQQLRGFLCDGIGLAGDDALEARGGRRQLLPAALLDRGERREQVRPVVLIAVGPVAGEGLRALGKTAEAELVAALEEGRGGPDLLGRVLPLPLLQGVDQLFHLGESFLLLG